MLKEQNVQDLGVWTAFEFHFLQKEIGMYVLLETIRGRFHRLADFYIHFPGVKEEDKCFFARHRKAKFEILQQKRGIFSSSDW